jgi:putative ABC transport system ATP-binding protein
MILELKNVRRSFSQAGKTLDVLRGLSFGADRGEFISIMGPSGSGKSTLLQIMGGIDRPSGGSVQIEGKAIETLSDNALSAFRRTKLGYVFQFFNLMPTLTAIDNVSLPLLLDGQSRSKVTARSRELLGFMGLAHREHHYPSQLSGGEMQRVAIARALIADPLVILADEPTGNLDSKTGAGVLELLSQIVRDRKQLLVMVTHDEKAARYGNRLIRINDGQVESDQRL